MAKRVNQIFCCVLVLLISGCAMTQEEKKAQRAVDDYQMGDYARAAKKLEPLADKKDENFALNNLRLGSADLARYDLQDAQDAFLKAYEVLNSFGVNNGGRTLGAVLVDEKIKIWRGEPFEKAMANFYLGLTYYMQHDYQNARAAFENALFKLKDYEDKSDDNDGKGDQFKDADSNFVIASIMLGRCWQHLGREDLARASFDAVIKQRPDLEPLANYGRNEESNLLLVVEYGEGPVRKTTFDGSILGFAPTPEQVGSVPAPRVEVDGEFVNPHLFHEAPVDLLAMAQDRKWQSIDTIRAVKSAIGTGLIAGGAVEGFRGLNESGSRQRTDLVVGASLLAAGALLKATSQSDVRGWDMLPRSVFLIPLHVSPGPHDVTVEFPRAGGLRQTWHGLVAPPQGDDTYLFHMLPYDSGPFEWPPPTVSQASAAN
jgi:tetratricopeptide (TPR) repeat protein